MKTFCKQWKYWYWLISTLLWNSKLSNVRKLSDRNKMLLGMLPSSRPINFITSVEYQSYDLFNTFSLLRPLCRCSVSFCTTAPHVTDNSDTQLNWVSMETRITAIFRRSPCVNSILRACTMVTTKFAPPRGPSSVYARPSGRRGTLAPTRSSTTEVSTICYNYSSGNATMPVAYPFAFHTSPRT